MSDEAVFTLKDSGLHDEEGKKTNVSNLLTEYQRRSGSFLSFMMMFHTEQDDPNFNYSRMNCRAFVQLPLYVDGICDSLDTQMLKIPHCFLIYLVDLKYGRKTDYGTLNKYRGAYFQNSALKGLKQNSYVV